MFMPQVIVVNKYDAHYKRILEQVEFVRGVRFDLDADPDEVSSDINPDSAPNFCYQGKLEDYDELGFYYCHVISKNKVFTFLTCNFIYIL